MPEGQYETLERFKEMYTSFLSEGPPSSAYDDDKAALEIRAMALVLSGSIPPYIDLAETMKSCDLVLNSTASLLPQKALMTG